MVSRTRLGKFEWHKLWVALLTVNLLLSSEVGPLLVIVDSTLKLLD